MAPLNVAVEGMPEEGTTATSGNTECLGPSTLARMPTPRPRFGFDSSGHFSRKKQSKFMRLRKECYTFLEEPTHSWAAFTCHVFVVCLVLASSVLVCLDTLDSFQDKPAIDIIEAVCSICFTIELILRIACWQDKYWRIFFSLWLWIDVLAIVPFYGSLISDAVSKRRTISTTGLRVLSIMRLLRLLRLLKLVRHYEGSAVLGIALQRSLVALLVPLFFLGMLCFVFGGIVYYIEGVIGGNEDFGDIFRAAWFVLVTLSTVGYGDMAPETVLGRLVTVPIIITGVLFMAMPISIVGNNFTVTWEERDVMLLASKIQKLHKRRGLTEADAVNIFQQFDNGGDGEVDISEFKKALEIMGIQLEQRQLASAFRAFDLDMSGTLSYTEFCDKVFPNRNKNLSAVGTIKSFIAMINKGLDIDSEDPLAWQNRTEACASRARLSPQSARPPSMITSSFQGRRHSFGSARQLETEAAFALRLQERAAQQAEQLKSERERVTAANGQAVDAALRASAAAVSERMDKYEERLASLESSVNRVLAHLEAALPLAGARPAPAYAPASESTYMPASLSASAVATTAAVAQVTTNKAATSVRIAAPAASDAAPAVEATASRRRRTPRKAASATGAPGIDQAARCTRLSPPRQQPFSQVT